MNQCKSLGGTEQATRKAVKLKSEEKMGFTKSVGRLIWKSPEKKNHLTIVKLLPVKQSRLKYGDLLPESDNVNNVSKSRNDISESRNKNNMSTSEIKTVIPLATSTVEYIAADDNRRNLLTSTQWRKGTSQDVTSYREYFNI